MAEAPLNFTSEQERQQWIIKNAAYFSVIRRRNRKNEREEHPTLGKARAAARAALGNDPTARFLIYAIDADGRDTFVEVVAT